MDHLTTPGGRTGSRRVRAQPAACQWRRLESVAHSDRSLEVMPSSSPLPRPELSIGGGGRGTQVLNELAQW